MQFRPARGSRECRGFQGARQFATNFLCGPTGVHGGHEAERRQPEEAATGRRITFDDYGTQGTTELVQRGSVIGHDDQVGGIESVGEGVGEQ